MTSTALTLASILLFWFFVSFFTRSTNYQKFATDTLFWSVVAGFLVARIMFVIALWEVYQKDWVSAFDIRDGGFNQQIGWFTGIMLLVIRSRAQRNLATTYLKSAVITGVVVFPLFVVNVLMNNQTAGKGIDVSNFEGEPETLNLQLGKPVIINFWASWCPPCRREMPILQDAQQQHRDMKFIFVNQSEAPAVARAFLSKQNIEIKNVYYDFSGRSAKELGAYGLPTTLFYNSEGKLINSHMGELSEASLQHYLQPFLEDNNET